ncbi:hypothetical protein T4C_3152 [Trichinella pseudospiralis]|uniref:Uncharacterized protein n=1 Tax=Trichinella pseudospiralis TaxID=6337 RepID=A0A0V1K1M8_TRIPS|nr:hypothetical protein T4C_3152 [Trichinella pseudospiralis]
MLMLMFKFREKSTNLYGNSAKCSTMDLVELYFEQNVLSQATKQITTNNNRWCNAQFRLWFVSSSERENLYGPFEASNLEVLISESIHRVYVTSSSSSSNMRQV